MLDNDRVGIARIRERRFVWVNPGTTRLFGHRAEALVGRPTREAGVSGDEWLTRADALPASAGAGQSLRMKCLRRHSDGHAVWTDISVR